MKKVFFFQISFLFLLFGCSVDKTDPNKFGALLLDDLVLKKTDAIKAYYLDEKDKNRALDTALNYFFNVRLKDSAYVQEYLKRQNKEIKEWYKVAVDKEITSDNVSFLRTELDSTTSFLNYKSYSFKIFFLINNKEHFFVVDDIDKMKDGWTIYSISPPTNELEEKRRLESIPYRPFGLRFTTCNWQYKGYSPTSFTNFYVTLSNKTGNDFDYVKFRISLSIQKNGNKEIVFSKTFERHEKIYDQDVINFEIIELKDFYIGVNVNNQDNFDWDGEIIDAKPRPNIK